MRDSLTDEVGRRAPVIGDFLGGASSRRWRVDTLPRGSID